jgi:hypothetical protein
MTPRNKIKSKGKSKSKSNRKSSSRFLHCVVSLSRGNFGRNDSAKQNQEQLQEQPQEQPQEQQQVSPLRCLAVASQLRSK